MARPSASAWLHFVAVAIGSVPLPMTGIVLETARRGLGVKYQLCTTTSMICRDVSANGHR